ncbi:MAG: transposase, partial [Paracoccaceae bacterium]
MPHKFNAEHRDKFTAARHRVKSWRDYNEALRMRGDVSVWFEDGVAGAWHAPRRKDPGGQAVYSDVAIEVCLTLRSVFRLPLRLVQGFVRSLLRLMDLELPTPDFSTLSRRATELKIEPTNLSSIGAITL